MPYPRVGAQGAEPREEMAGGERTGTLLSAEKGGGSHPPLLPQRSVRRLRAPIPEGTAAVCPPPKTHTHPGAAPPAPPSPAPTAAAGAGAAPPARPRAAAAAPAAAVAAVRAVPAAGAVRAVPAAPREGRPLARPSRAAARAPRPHLRRPPAPPAGGSPALRPAGIVTMIILFFNYFFSCCPLPPTTTALSRGSRQAGHAVPAPHPLSFGYGARPATCRPRAAQQ